MLKIEERFWAKVDRSGGPEACWLWVAGKYRKGYGQFHPSRTRTVSAHKFSYELAFGPLPPGLCALHRCDNPACVNPRHLFAGTHADNMYDMVLKARQAKLNGSKNGASKLSEEQVAEIRRLSALGMSQRALAERFGVSRKNISLIARRKVWTHVEEGG